MSFFKRLFGSRTENSGEKTDTVKAAGAAPSPRLETAAPTEPTAPPAKAATQPPSPATAVNTTIAGVRLLIQSDVLSLGGGVVLTPPASLVPSVDEELARSGRTRPGEFAAFVQQHGLGQPLLKGRLTDAQLRSSCVGFFPSNEWACCTRMTEMTTYNVVIAFHAAGGARKSESAPATSTPRRRVEPFDTLIDGLRADGLEEAATDINNALRVVKWPSTESFIAGMADELKRIRREVGQKMTPATASALEGSLNRIRNL
jgi:hypothetical protein